MKENLKSFEELMSGGGDNESKDLPEGKEITDEEIEIRIDIFLNGWRAVEKEYRKSLNNLSFQLNRKLAVGCQAKELIGFYNDWIGGFLDDFIY